VQLGGYGFSPARIGAIGSIAGFIVVIVNLVLVPRLLKKIGPVYAFRLAAIVYLPTVMFMPLLSLLAPYYETSTPVLIVFFALFILNILWRVMALNTMFTSVFVLINNAVMPENRGKLNGFGQSLVAVTRCIGPTLGSSLFSWSLTNELSFPFNIYFTFIVMFVLHCVNIGLSWILPRATDKPKNEIVAALKK